MESTSGTARGSVQEVADRDLVELTKAGDDRAFAELISARCPAPGGRTPPSPSTGLCRRRPAGGIPAGIPAHRRVWNDSSVFTWLYRITFNTCLDEIRRHRKVGLLPPDADAPGLEAGPAEQAVARIEATELGRLTPERRSTVVLVHGYGFDYAEASRAPGRTTRNPSPPVSTGCAAGCGPRRSGPMPRETSKPMKEVIPRAVQEIVTTSTHTLPIASPIAFERRRAVPGPVALTVAALGAGLCLVAAVVGLQVWSSTGRGAAEATDPAPTTPGPGPIILHGPGDVAVVSVVYEPGQTSGWHAHGGLHAVAVLAGELTVYDRECQPHRFGPGQPYVGGQDLHLARNETAQPVDMIVTYINAAVPSVADVRASSAPANCAVS